MIKVKRITSLERRMCLGKTPHKSLLAAVEHVNELRKFSKTPASLNYYTCQFCKFYHVGNHFKNINYD